MNILKISRGARSANNVWEQNGKEERHTARKKMKESLRFQLFEDEEQFAHFVHVLMRELRCSRNRVEVSKKKTIIKKKTQLWIEYIILSRMENSSFLIYLPLILMCVTWSPPDLPLPRAKEVNISIEKLNSTRRERTNELNGNISNNCKKVNEEISEKERESRIMKN